MNNLRVKFGKYLNKIDQSVPPDTIMLNESGVVTRSVEPGEPQLPTAESYTVGLANLDPQGNERYPFSYWQSQSRQPEEGASQDLQIYFQVFVDGVSQFVGMVKEINYSKYQAVCSIELGDVAELLRVEERNMLKAFEFQIPIDLRISDEHEGIFLDAPGVDYNDLPALKDIEGNAVPHEAITFQLMRSKDRITGDIPRGIRRGAETFEGENLDIGMQFASHLGWFSQDARDSIVDYVLPVKDNDGLVLIEDVSTRYVQIEDITLFTRVRIWIEQVSTGVRAHQVMWCTVWHNGQDITGTLVPRGKFIAKDGEITEETEDLTVIFHEPNLGFDDDIAMYKSSLPMKEKFIFGIPYTESGSAIQMTSDSYAFFDVLEKTIQIINTDISSRHTDTSLSGSIEITDFTPEQTSGVKASGFLEIDRSPRSSEDLFIIIHKDGSQRETGTFPAGRDESKEVIFARAIDAINNSPATSEFWETANETGTSCNIVAKNTGDQWNGYSITVRQMRDGRSEVPDSRWPSSTTAGGTGAFVSSGIDVIISGSVFATTDAIVDSDSLSDIAQKAYDACIAVGDPDFNFSIDNTVLGVTTDTNQIIDLSLDTKSTTVKYTTHSIAGDFQLFDLSRLRDSYRLGFYSDVIMYGWLENSILECLISAGWQVGAILFTTNEGKIAIHSRDYYEFYPDDTADEDFDAVLIHDLEWEPTSGDQYQQGFKSYETEHPIDIIEVNNLISKEKRTIYSDKNGAIKSPTLRNKKIRTGNYRIFNLEVTVREFRFRFSPDDENWPHDRLDRFLPTPRIQLNRVAKAFPFPTIGNRMNVYWKLYSSIDVGKYVYGEDSTLWLVKNFRLEPKTFTAELELEFKKNIVDNSVKEVEQIKVSDHFEFKQHVIASFKDGVETDDHDATSIGESYIDEVETGEHTSEDVTPPET